uniref:Peptidyl-prolyl cis-trans isomerase n=1 Tax=Fervidobacterium pennivorans TaxID=93466 RepID=A0A7V4NE31_FERPE
MKRYFRIFNLLVILSILFASSLVLSNGLQKFAAYLEKNGTIVAGISQEDIDELYQLYEQYYGSFDPLFEKPYVEALVMKRLLEDKSIDYLSTAEGLSLEDFRSSHSDVSEDEMREYYENNRQQIQEEAYVDFDYAVFETEEKAKEFYNRANEVGFEKAVQELSEASPSELLDTDTYLGLKKSETSEAFVNVLFTPSEKPLRMHTTDNASFVFYIRNLNDLSTFEKFKDSPMYEEVMSSLSENKFQKYVEEKISTENIKFIVPSQYAIWFDMVQNVPAEKLAEKYYSSVFDKSGNLLSVEPLEISGFITVIEDAKLDEKYKKEYELAIKKLYDMGYKSFLVLTRLRNFDNSENVVLEYNVELSKILIGYIKNGDTLSVLQYIYSNLSELEELSNSENPEIRQKALEYLYKMNKILGDEESSKKYLEKLNQENPNYSVEDEE